MIPAGNFHTSNLDSKVTPRSAMRVSSSSSVGNSATFPASLKGKLQTLEEIIHQLQDEEGRVTREVQRLRAERDTIDNELTHGCQDVKAQIESLVGETEDELSQQMSNQRAENSRLQLQLSQLKADKTNLQEQIIALENRISDIEGSIGDDICRHKAVICCNP